MSPTLQYGSQTGLDNRPKVVSRPILFSSAGLQIVGCLHELFEEQVDRRPDAPALICDGVSMSYAELDWRTNQLARYLRLAGAGPETLVGLYFERSMSPVIAILACLKAGAAYVPLDPAYPAERMRHILSEAAPVLLLTEQALLAQSTALFDRRIILLDSEWRAVSELPSHRLSRDESGVSPENLCYVIYTSGSTGQPKGVMTEHGCAFRFVRAFNRVCATGPEDRVYQGFSLGFDGSVEEMWMAFSNGSALVVGTPQTPRFGDELGQFLTDNGVTYLSTVPTLLSTVTRDIPTLRLLVVSGEICPGELVNRWTRTDLRMFNVYGPTEATVNTTAAECTAGVPVTIGRPLPGYELYILDENLCPVPRGSKGELFIGGATLARGYLNRPELSAERFLRCSAISTGARLYRTGDLVRESEQGEIEFFGRLDDQIKIRGYRVELAEIESVLLEHPQIRSASVKLVQHDGLQQLAGYVVLRNAGQPLDRDGLLSYLEARLPAYMLPAHLDVVQSLPLLASGKVNRAALPAPVVPLLHGTARVVAPATAMEAMIAAVWSRILGLPQVSVEDDFFHDLGGYSLLAAQMVTQLRGELGQKVTVREAYQFPTIRKLAAHLTALKEGAPPPREELTPRPAPSSKVIFESQPRRVRWTTTALQLFSTYWLSGVGILPLVGYFLFGRAWLLGHLSTARLVEWVVAIALLSWPAGLLLSVAAKWLLIGRYRAGAYPLWGFYYFRFWLASRLQAGSGVGSLVGTPLLPLYYRLMGARVGRQCTLNTALCTCWDLIRIGDDTSIGADTQLLGYRVENGLLLLGRVDIGSRCFIGIHSALGLDVRMEDDTRLDDQSLLADRQVIRAGTACLGSPAHPGPVEVPEPPAGRPVRRHPVLLGTAQLASMLALSVITLPTLFPMIGLLYGCWVLVYQDRLSLAAACLAVAAPVSVLISCFVIAGLKRLVLSRARPGVYPVGSILYLRKWLSDGIMRASRASLLPLYTTLYLPPWLRLMRARIGARAELSTVWHFSPELIDVGEESFFADGSIIGGMRIFRGQFAIGLNRIGRRSFVGNSAILPVGASLGDRCLLGVQSIPPPAPQGCERCTPDGTEWLGSPAFALPPRPRVGNFEARVLFQPSWKLYLQRAVIDGLRILIPAYIGLLNLAASVLTLNFVLGWLGFWVMVALAPLIAVFFGLVSVLLVAGLKKLIMGTFKPVIKPLWSMYVWLNEMINGVYESIMAPAIAPYLGTPLVAPLLRLLGCKIGRHTFIATTLFSEFDLVEIGDYAALNFGAVIQNHLFEDRVMKSSYLKVGPSCSVGNMAVVLYDSEMQEGSVLGPHSLLMKGETLAPGERWHGIPCTHEPPQAALGAREPAALYGVR